MDLQTTHIPDIDVIFDLASEELAEVKLENYISAARRLSEREFSMKKGFLCVYTASLLFILSACHDATPSTPRKSLENTWLFIVTHRGTPMPREGFSFLCGEAMTRRLVLAWMDREADKYGKKRLFDDIVCLEEQLQLPPDLLAGRTVFAEGKSFSLPVDDTGTIVYLERNVPKVAQARYVTIFHYIPEDMPFVDREYLKKYDFNFIKSPSPEILFYPPLSLDSYGTTLAHEFMHKLGATDKYDGAAQACTINPATGQEFSGFDIMCHRISDQGAYIQPTFFSLVVSGATAREIGWQ